jgi:hypothetical protein
LDKRRRKEEEFILEERANGFFVIKNKKGYCLSRQNNMLVFKDEINDQGFLWRYERNTLQKPMMGQNVGYTQSQGMGLGQQSQGMGQNVGYTQSQGMGQNVGYTQSQGMQQPIYNPQFSQQMGSTNKENILDSQFFPHEGEEIILINALGGCVGGSPKTDVPLTVCGQWSEGDTFLVEKYMAKFSFRHKLTGFYLSADQK